MLVFKKFTCLILTFCLINFPLHAGSKKQENSLRKSVSSISKLSVKELLSQGAMKSKNKAQKNLINKALAKLKKDPSLGNVQIGQSLDSAAFFFLTHTEKDFIQHELVYTFYLGFKSVFRGLRLASFNKKCVYRSTNSNPFSLVSYLNGKNDCAKPTGYPRNFSSDKVIRTLEKALRANSRVLKISGFKAPNYKAMGEKIASTLLGLVFPDANAQPENLYGISFLMLAGLAAVIAGTVIAATGVGLVPGGILIGIGAVGLLSGATAIAISTM